MLEKLTIENYALIEHVEFEPGEGFSIITGETGAGKSIMLGALNLLSGTRNDTKGRKEQDDRKTVVEATFSRLDDNTLKWLELSDDSYEKSTDGSVILRREITATGRSRAFVNDSPVTLTRLSEVAARLMDIHSQHSNQSLTHPSEQLRILDIFCGNSDIRNEYRVLLKKYIGLRNKIKEIRKQTERSKENREYISYQLEQLEALNPKSGELEEVEREFDILSDAENIRAGLSAACSALSGEGNSALYKLSEAHDNLSILGKSLNSISSDDNLQERIEGLIIEIKDISQTIHQLSEKAITDPVELKKKGDRLQALYDAQKQFRVAGNEELVKLRDDLRKQMLMMDGTDESTVELEREARKIAELLKEQSKRLSESRKAGAQEFEKEVKKRAGGLGLKNLDFKVQIEPCKFTMAGADAVTLMCSFNKNGKLQSLGKVASGGEMSRMMLALKDVMADKMQLPTIIFDEVDTGVSGEIADRMGAMMASMARKMQVLAITHLPQVAAKGEQHFLVYKDDDNQRTRTFVRRLDYRERENELARMLSGAVVDKAALENARSLLGLSDKQEK